MSDQAQLLHLDGHSHAQQPLQMHGIVTPHDHDVLSGRGNFVNYHPGNEHFRALVRKHKMQYVECPKPQKGKFSRLIVDEIKRRDPPGRFLKQDSSSKLWYDIGDKKALDKTRQALREGAPDILKKVKPDDEEDSTPRAVLEVRSDISTSFMSIFGHYHEKQRCCRLCVVAVDVLSTMACCICGLLLLVPTTTPYHYSIFLQLIPHTPSLSQTQTRANTHVNT